jgi:hypothetical protein
MFLGMSSYFRNALCFVTRHELRHVLYSSNIVVPSFFLTKKLVQHIDLLRRPDSINRQGSLKFVLDSYASKI